MHSLPGKAPKIPTERWRREEGHAEKRATKAAITVKQFMECLREVSQRGPSIAPRAQHGGAWTYLLARPTLTVLGKCGRRGRVTVAGKGKGGCNHRGQAKMTLIISSWIFEGFARWKGKLLGKVTI